MTTETILSPDAIKQILDLGGAATPLRCLSNGDQLLTLPDSFKSERITDPDRVPIVTRRAPKFSETSSFIDYVNTFKKEGQTRIFANAETLNVVAVVDYDSPDQAARGVHTATLQLQISPEWRTWNAVATQTKAKGLTQEEFAEFLEEHGVDVHTPDASTLMGIITTMQVTRSVTYKKAFNLTDGRQQFTYSNDGDSGAVEFPARLALGIPVFKGGERYKVEIILRYRLQDDGKLRFALIVHRKDEILRTALMGNGDDIEGDIVAIQTQTGVPVHMGTLG